LLYGALIKWGDLVTTLGVRYDEHDQYGGQVTYRITPAYRYASTATLFKVTYGTAFNSPSLYQLYVDDVYSQGNPELEPETSVGWDVGLEQSLLEQQVVLGATYFQAKYTHQISASFDAGTFK